MSCSHCEEHCPSPSSKHIVAQAVGVPVGTRLRVEAPRIGLSDETYLHETYREGDAMIVLRVGPKPVVSGGLYTNIHLMGIALVRKLEVVKGGLG